MSAVTATTFAARSENLVPWTVSEPEAFRSGNNWTINWLARSRFASDWADGEPFGYDPDFLLFRVYIYLDNTYDERVRTIHVIPTIDPSALQSITYTEAWQMVDFGSVQSTIYYQVVQVSSYGGGRRENLVGVA